MRPPTPSSTPRRASLHAWCAASLAALVLSCGAAPAAPASPPAGAKITSTGAVAEVAEVAAVGEDDAAVPISTSDPAWGSRRALVSVVLFGDLQCPFTGKVLTTVHALEEKYGPADLRVVWKELPLSFHAEARPAAEAAEAVFILGRSDAFWRFAEQALAHPSDLSAAAYEAWAVGAGVDLGTFRRTAAAHAGGAKVDADHALADRLHVSGTPTAFVNGVQVSGAQPVERFVAVIDAELAKAKSRLAAGVTPDALYTEASKANFKAPAAAPEDDDEPKADTKTVWNVPVGGAPVRGGASALVTVVVFSDFQCPYCKRVEPTLQRVRETYGDKVRIVWKDEPLPFHPHAMPAAELAREARAEKGEAGFWAAHDALFDAQPKLEDDDLVALGKKLGLDASRVRRAITEKKYEAQIRADVDLSDDVHASGTPHFFVNGRRLVGAQPFEAFQAVIDEEIHHAEDLVASGTPRRALYDAMMKTAVTPPLAEVREVAPRATAPFKGPAGAPVVIEEFSDFECPFCARAEPTLAEVTKAYGGKVKIVWRNLPLPFHKHAQLAAEAAAEAQHQKGNAGFWAMHDKLYAHQGDHDGSGLERPALDVYAREVGLDVAAFDKALDEHTHQAEVQADKDAAGAAQISGTPAFIVGGYLIPGAQPMNKFRRIIDKVIASGPAKP